MKIIRYLLLPVVSAVMLVFPTSCGNKVLKVKGDSVIVRLSSPVEGGPSQVRLQVLGEKIVRVSATPDKKFHDRKSLVVLPG